MKKIILGIIVAHSITLAATLLSNQGILTILAILVIQNFFIVLITLIQGLQQGKGIFKFMYVVQGLNMVFIASALVFFAGVLSTIDTVNINGQEETLRLGELSVFTVIIGSAAFLITYLREARYRKQQKLHFEILKNVRSFMILYLNCAATLIMFIIAVIINERSNIAVVVIALIKITLDIGLLLLETGLGRINLHINRFFPAQTKK